METIALQGNTMRESSTRRKTTILVVDDDTDSLVAMRKLLESEYAVLTADNGRDALETALAHEVDLVVLDVQMPLLNGYETFREFKSTERTREVPVLFLTACRGVDDELEALNQGAVDFLTKPCPPQRLLGRVKNQVERAAERRVLLERSSKDPLTGLSNRRELTESLEREWQAALRLGTPVSIVLLDVDHFKAFNDSHGHTAGDTCLRQVATAINSQANRPHDVAARFGGEEFLVLLPDTDFRGAWNTAEAIRESVDALTLENGSRDNDAPCVGVTLSAGVACHHPRWVEGRPDLHYSELIDLADKHLFRAKREGRNRVHGDGTTG